MSYTVLYRVAFMGASYPYTDPSEGSYFLLKRLTAQPTPRCRGFYFPFAQSLVDKPIHFNVVIQIQRCTS